MNNVIRNDISRIQRQYSDSPILPTLVVERVWTEINSDPWKLTKTMNSILGTNRVLKIDKFIRMESSHYQSVFVIKTEKFNASFLYNREDEDRLQIFFSPNFLIKHNFLGLHHHFVSNVSYYNFNEHYEMVDGFVDILAMFKDNMIQQAITLKYC